MHILNSDAENTPPAMALSRYGVVGNLVGFSTNYSDVYRPEDIFQAVVDGKHRRRDRVGPDRRLLRASRCKVPLVMHAGRRGHGGRHPVCLQHGNGSPPAGHASSGTACRRHRPAGARHREDPARISAFHAALDAAARPSGASAPRGRLEDAVTRIMRIAQPCPSQSRRLRLASQRHRRSDEHVTCMTVRRRLPRGRGAGTERAGCAMTPTRSRSRRRGTRSTQNAYSGLEAVRAQLLPAATASTAWAPRSRPR